MIIVRPASKGYVNRKAKLIEEVITAIFTRVTDIGDTRVTTSGDTRVGNG
jgi:hypothetical protein